MNNLSIIALLTNMNHPSRKKQRLLTGLILAGLIPLGLVSKAYHGPGSAWVQGHLGGMVYVVFWCLAALLVWPRARPWLIALFVFVATCGLEFMQLWQPERLQQIRASFVGAALLGTTFVWADFLYYALGCALAWLIMHLMKRNPDPLQ